MISVTPSDPRALERQFIEAFPALELRATIASGAIFSDGDARSACFRTDRPVFALEAKVRLSERKPLRASVSELRKAIAQLRRPGVIPLVVVYSVPRRSYTVTLLEDDARHLEDLGLEVGGLATRRQHLAMRVLREDEWLALYRRIEQWSS